MDEARLRGQLAEHEGVRRFPYKDTLGKLTIGVGRNLTDRGITPEEVHFLLAHDVAIVIEDLDHHLPWWRALSEVRQMVLADMCFNLGVSRLLGFRNTLQMLASGNYGGTAKGMLHSKWAKQVGRRARRLALMMKLDTEVALTEVDELFKQHF
jgi:lysozyme